MTTIEIENASEAPVPTGIAGLPRFVRLLPARIIWLFLAWESFRLYVRYGGEMSVLAMIFPMIAGGFLTYQAYRIATAVAVWRSEGREGLHNYLAGFWTKTQQRLEKTSLLSWAAVFFWSLIFLSGHVFTGMTGWAIDGRPVRGIELLRPDAHRVAIVPSSIRLTPFDGTVKGAARDGAWMAANFDVELNILPQAWDSVAERSEPGAEVRAAAKEILRAELASLIATYRSEELTEPFFFDLMTHRALRGKFEALGYEARVIFANVRSAREAQ